MSPNSLRSYVPQPLASGIATVLDAIGLREKYVREPHGFDPKRGIQADVAVYYPDNVSKLYQLSQWLPVFENHPEDLTFALVVRNIHTFRELEGKTTLPLAHVPNFSDLMNLYRLSSFKAVVYVNNGVANFQSLNVGELAHVHINHGESDKICMVSNQAKAYDRVFVAGEAAVQRHKAALSEFNEKNLVRIGRPQLDQHPQASLPESDRTTILYAPTWAGEDEANNYTSMEFMGSAIIDAALAQPHSRVVYKPHPRIIDSNDDRIQKNHKHIVASIKAANAKDPQAGHEVRESGEILALFPNVDVLVSDVSSVGLDFLYLRPEAPLVLTDRRDNVDQLRIDAPISVATQVLTKSNIGQVNDLLAHVIEHDDYVEARRQLRTFYFDNVQTGQSSERFFSALRSTIEQHSADLARARSLAATGTGPHITRTEDGQH